MDLSHQQIPGILAFKHKTARLFFIRALIAIAFLLPYSSVNAWDFIPATLLIVYLARPWLGLPHSRQDFGASIVLSLMLALIFRGLLPWIALRHGLRFDPSAWSYPLRSRPVFQVLNEEMLLRAALLQWLSTGTLLQKTGTQTRANSWVRVASISSVVAVVIFCVAHVAFYLWKDGTVLGAAALLNLALFSLIANALYWRAGHIGYCYALHVGWNLTRFGGDFYSGVSRVSEGVAFNRLEGSHEMTVLLLSILALGAIAGLRSPRRHQSLQ